MGVGGQDMKGTAGRKADAVWVSRLPSGGSPQLLILPFCSAVKAILHLALVR